MSSLDLVKEKGKDKMIFCSPWGNTGTELQVKMTQEYAHWTTLGRVGGEPSLVTGGFAQNKSSHDWFLLQIILCVHSGL